MLGAVNREKPTPRHSPRRGRSGQPGNSETRHVDVTGDYGYVVVPAIMTFDLRGKQLRKRFGLYAGASPGGRSVASDGVGLGERGVIFAPRDTCAPVRQTGYSGLRRNRSSIAFFCRSTMSATAFRC